mmetsp:Transcript_16045/g.37188  ORF Transcript_16045/g.37188 Transcript_16045/m.37188 type:complete len:92 (+) Transcript_16045:599-874(+)
MNSALTCSELSFCQNVKADCAGLIRLPPPELPSLENCGATATQSERFSFGILQSDKSLLSRMDVLLFDELINYEGSRYRAIECERGKLCSC